MAEKTTETGQVTWLKWKYARPKAVAKNNRGKSGGTVAAKKPAKGKK